MRIGKESMKIKNNIAFFLIVLVAISIYILFGISKKGYFIDEVYSYGLSNSEYRTDISEFDIFDKWIDNESFYEYITVSDGGRFNYEAVYKNQINDVHPPLYYMLLHSVCSVFAGQYNKWQGIGINIFLSIFIFLLLRLICDKIFDKNKNISNAVALIYALSTMTISNVIYIRMYILLTLFTIIYAYLHILVVEHRINTKKLFFIGIVFILGMMTQYYFIITAFFISMLFTLYLWYSKEFKKSIFYIITMLISLLASYMLFPFMIEQLLGNNNNYLSSISGGSIIIRGLINALSFASNINYGLFAGEIGLGFGFIVVLFLILYRRKKEVLTNRLFLGAFFKNRYVSAIAIVLFLNLITLFFVVWIPAARYYYSLIPFLCIILVYGFNTLIENLEKDINFKKILYKSLIIFFVTLNAWGYIKSLSYKENDFRKALPVEYLYAHEKSILNELKKREDIGCIFITNYKNASITQDIIELLHMDRIYISSIQNIDAAISDLKLLENKIVIIDSNSLYDENLADEKEVEARLALEGLSFGERIYTKELTNAYWIK